MSALRQNVTEADVAMIRAMVQASGVFSPEEVDVAEELAQDARTLGDASHYNFVLLERGGELAGYACFGRIPLTDARYDLYWIVTDTAKQRSGVAAELMRAAADAIRALGGKAIYAETSSREVYAPAHGFYRRSGFTLDARQKDFYADGDDKLTYRLAL